MKQSDKPRPIIPPAVPCEYIGKKSDYSSIFGVILLFTVGVAMVLAVFFYKQTIRKEFDKEVSEESVGVETILTLVIIMAAVHLHL